MSQHDALPGMAPGSSPANIFTLCSMSLGIGVFVLPVQCAQCGLGIGLFLIILFGIFSNFAMQLVIRAANCTGASTYEGLAYRAFGRAGPPLLSLCLAVTTFTGNASHVAFVSELLYEIIEYARAHVSIDESSKAFGKSRVIKVWTIAIVLAVALPFCFFRTIGALRYFATFSVCWVTFTALVTSGYCLYHISQHGAAHYVWAAADYNSIANIMSVCAFAFSSMLTVFPVLAEAKCRALVPRDVHIASLLITVFYAFIAVIGAVAYGSGQVETVLDNFKLDNYFMTVLKAVLMVCITLLYPVINFPMVAATDTFLFPRATSVKQLHRGIISILGGILIMGLVVGVGQLTPVFILCGGLGFGSVSYSLPLVIVLILLLRRDPPTHLLDPADAALLPRPSVDPPPITWTSKPQPVALFGEMSHEETGRVDLHGDSDEAAGSEKAALLSVDASDGKGRPVLDARYCVVTYLDESSPLRRSPTFSAVRFPGSGPASSLMVPEAPLMRSGVDLGFQDSHRLSVLHPFVLLSIIIVIVGFFLMVSSVVSAIQTAIASPAVETGTPTPWDVPPNALESVRRYIISH